MSSARTRSGGVGECGFGRRKRLGVLENLLESFGDGEHRVRLLNRKRSSHIQEMAEDVDAA